MYSGVCGGTQLANCAAQSMGPVDCAPVCRWLRSRPILQRGSNNGKVIMFTFEAGGRVSGRSGV